MALELDPRRSLVVAKKEFMDNVRNKWVLALTAIFIVLTLAMSYFTISTAPSSISEASVMGGWDPTTNTPVLGDGGLGGRPFDAYVVSTAANFTFDGQTIEFNQSDLVVHVDGRWRRLEFMGGWDAAANVPELSDGGGGGEQGDLYVVQVAGSTPLDGEDDWAANDLLVNWDGEWVKLSGPESSVGFKGYSETVASMSTVAAMLLPIIAIMLGYASIIGERENGSLGVVLACPLSRADVVVGKFVGLGAVLLVTVFAGFGISGLAIGAAAGFDGGLEYLLFIALTFLFGMFFLGFSVFMSALARRRATAIAGGLGIFFSGMIAGTVLLGIWVATGGDMSAMMEQAMSGQMPELPDWLWAGYYFSFMDIYPMGAMELFGTSEFFGYEMQYPWFINAPMIFAWFALLTLATFAGTLATLRKKDV